MECCYACTAYFFEYCHKHNSLPLGPTLPSSPSTKKLHDLALKNLQIKMPLHGKIAYVWTEPKGEPRIQHFNQ